MQASRGITGLVNQALLDPAHRTVALTAADGRRGAEVIVLPGGTAYFVNRSLPELGTARTFQLWAVSKGKVVSLGVLGPAPEAVPVRVEAPVTALMVTAEPSGGTPGPTTPVLLRGSLPVSA